MSSQALFARTSLLEGLDELALLRRPANLNNNVGEREALEVDDGAGDLRGVNESLQFEEKPARECVDGRRRRRRRAASYI